MPDTSTHQQIMRRLTPLYLATFLQGFVLWYAVEKLFMTSIGFTAGTIGLMAAAYSAMMLAIDTPAGMLADRWSRKGMLIIGSLMLAISSLVCGLSNSVPMFILGAALWGIFYGFYSGMYDSIVYDTLTEEVGHARDYERYFGRIRVMDSIALIIGSLIGGFIGSQFGLRASFYLTIPIALISLIPLISFREPQLHRQAVKTTFIEHIRETLTAVLRRSSLTQVLVMLVLGSFISNMIFEFSQLWLIATNSPLWLYGPANAVILASLGLAGLLAPHLNIDRPIPRIITVTVAILSAGLSLVAHNPFVAIVVLFTLCLIFRALDIKFLRLLHDQLPSHIRSGSSSTVGTITRILFIGGSLALGWLAERYDVFTGGWVIVVPTIIVCYLLFRPRTTT